MQSAAGPPALRGVDTPLTLSSLILPIASLTACIPSASASRFGAVQAVPPSRYVEEEIVTHHTRPKLGPDIMIAQHLVELDDDPGVRYMRIVVALASVDASKYVLPGDRERPRKLNR